MKIKTVKIKNFRSYKDEIKIDFKKMNIILGKNDIGKSTILEALDIFFNEGNGCVSISKEDININNFENPVEITVVFDEFDDRIILETIPTSISGEYLLNAEGDLEIKKVYQGGTMKVGIFIVADHPSNDEFIKKLLLKKISELQSYITTNSISVSGDARISSILRESIRNNYGELTFELQDIPADKEGAKELWSQIQMKLPVYSLFQSDRSNSDQDDEIQNPMTIALKNILAKSEIATILRGVFEEVKTEMKSIADGTLLQLHGINSSLAAELSPKLPDFEKLGWNKAFSKTEITSDNIPINKRGSGVKRMILLSFFLNEVERRKREEGLADVIYAFEEPETSQHPSHQEILIEAFNVLSQEDGVQVILTTHSPYVYKKFTREPNVNLIHVGVDGAGNKRIEDIFSSFNLFPHSPSWGEINYYVYGLPTFEFFDELYSRLEELNDTGSHVDDYIFLKNSSILKNEQWKVANDDGTQKQKGGRDVIWDSTYITCIRHQIHHSNNNLNSDYKSRVDEGIQDIINILNS